MTTSGGSGYCDCGDVEAWKQDPACDLHKVQQDEQQTSKYALRFPHLVPSQISAETSLRRRANSGGLK
ncbi:unnamed protein product [Gongylonema pulchrum]|uniref:E3 ubiquitin-protein ligase n=1 Tax=Gongylonema pulchrum TaxID=637853 RepID=A0A183DCZ8_9BILA|nr:unnamed protein product [Gongylonema pulchrum]